MSKKNFWESVLYEGNLPIMPGTEGIRLPSGTSAQRPGSPQAGTVRYNLDTERFEGFESNQWVPLGGYPFVDTIQDLRDLNSRPAYVFVSGAVSPGDGLAGIYRWMAGSLSPDDGFNVIAPSVFPNGRWFRIGMSDLPSTRTTTVNSGTGVILTGSQMTSTVLFRTGIVGSVSDTTASAAQIVANIPGAIVGTSRELNIQNLGSSLLTLLPGSGVTLSGTTTVQNGRCRRYLIIVDNPIPTAEAVTLLGVSTADV